MRRTFIVGTNTIAIAYRPNLLSKNMISSFEVNGVPLYQLLRHGLFGFAGVHAYVDPSVWVMTKIVYDCAKVAETTGDRKLATHISDYLFNRFGGKWRTFLNAGLVPQSASLMMQACKDVWDWEKLNKPVLIHKGSPFYFLASSYAYMESWTQAFTFVFSAIEEDRRAYVTSSNPDRFKRSPAYMYATLVNCKKNIFYPYVSTIRKFLLKQLRNYRNETSSAFNYLDFEDQFLRNQDLEQIVFLFVNQLQEIASRQYNMSAQLSDNEYSKIKNLNTIFNLCLVVDKVLENRYRMLPKEFRESLGKNIFTFFAERGWLGTERDAGQLKGSFTVAGLNIASTPNTICRKIIRRNPRIIYNGSVVSTEIISFILVWNLRNYGGHNIKAQNVLIKKYDKIIRLILYCLFNSLS